METVQTSSQDSLLISNNEYFYEDIPVVISDDHIEPLLEEAIVIETSQQNNSVECSDKKIERVLDNFKHVASEEEQDIDTLLNLDSYMYPAGNAECQENLICNSTMDMDPCTSTNTVPQSDISISKEKSAAQVLKENGQQEKVADKMDSKKVELQGKMKDKENNGNLTHKKYDKSCEENNIFDKAFTLPLQYLPKKKRVKLERKGKPKLPAVGTGDEWYKIHMQREEEQRLKEEKLAKKKELQAEKKKLAEKKKKLKELMKQIQFKIKKEVS